MLYGCGGESVRPAAPSLRVLEQRQLVPCRSPPLQRASTKTYQLFNVRVIISASYDRFCVCPLSGEAFDGLLLFSPYPGALHAAWRHVFLLSHSTETSIIQLLRTLGASLRKRLSRHPIFSATLQDVRDLLLPTPPFPRRDCSPGGLHHC